jgi:hypothetical protein
VPAKGAEICTVLTRPVLSAVMATSTVTARAPTQPRTAGVRAVNTARISTAAKA